MAAGHGGWQQAWCRAAEKMEQARYGSRQSSRAGEQGRAAGRGSRARSRATGQQGRAREQGAQGKGAGQQGQGREAANINQEIC